MEKKRRLILASCLFLLGSTINGFAQPSRGEVHGYVKNALTKAVIANARVIVSSLWQETVTDDEGFYKIVLPLGTHKIEVSADGYRSAAKDVVVQTDAVVRFDFLMQQILYAIPAIDVIAERLRFPEAGRVDLRTHDLQNQPALAEPDVLRAMQTLPGVSNVTDWSSEFYVRGGHFDQTLVLWDGVPIYNPNHLGGLFSAFIPESIQRISLYKGGQPLYFDSRLSGILDIKPTFGNPDRRKWNGSFGVSSASLSAEGPLGPGSYAFSARRTYLDILSLAFGEKLPYNFWDASANYTAALGQNDALYLSTFYSTDNLAILEKNVMGLDEGDIKQQPRWGNRLFNFRWRHLLCSQHLMELSIFRSRSFVDGESQELRADNLIDEIGAGAQLFAKFRSHTLLFSLNLRKRLFSYAWSLHSDDLSDVIHPPAEAFFDYAPPDFNFRKESKAAAFAVEDEVALSRRLSVALGIKGNWHSLAQDLKLTPRLGLTYRAGEKFALRAVTARYYQYLYTLKERRTENILAPFTAYFPADHSSAVPPSRADHAIIGLEIINLPASLSLNTEVYYKRYHDLITSVNDLPRLRLENGRAMGVDIQIGRETGRASGWLGYSFGVSQKRNSAYEYYTSYDRRHSVKLLGDVELSKKWKLNFFWIYSSGAPYTPIIGRYYSGQDLREERSGGGVPIDWPGSPIGVRPLEGAKNSLRFPAYHRLDVALQGRYRWGNASLVPIIQVLNIYNHANAFHYVWELEYREPKQETARGIPILPTVGMRVEF